MPRAKSIACTDRASLSELIVALNGYTVTSGILVGISDGAGLNTVPLDTDVKLHLGYVVRKGEALSDIGQRFVDTLKKNLEKYARSVQAMLLARGTLASASSANATGESSSCSKYRYGKSSISSSERLEAFTIGWLFGSATRGADWMSSTNSRPAASSAAFTSSAVAEV